MVTVFILPPSFTELQHRLQRRGTDSEAVIHHRLKNLQQQVSCWQGYDYVIVNQDIEQSVNMLRHILLAERLKRARQQQKVEKIVTDLLCACVTRYDL